MATDASKNAEGVKLVHPSIPPTPTPHSSPTPKPAPAGDTDELAGNNESANITAGDNITASVNITSGDNFTSGANIPIDEVENSWWDKMREGVYLWWNKALDVPYDNIALWDNLLFGIKPKKYLFRDNVSNRTSLWHKPRNSSSNPVDAFVRKTLETNESIMTQTVNNATSPAA